MIDSSNACFEDARKILRAAKKRFPDMPFGIGNIIKGEDYKKFAESAGCRLQSDLCAQRR